MLRRNQRCCRPRTCPLTSTPIIECTISWLSGYRSLSPRYERNPRNYLAFLGLAAALCCYRRLLKLTT